jgi:hypothetical protein
MRSFILGILIVLAVPAYAVGQRRDRSERSATRRTAVPHCLAMRFDRGAGDTAMAARSPPPVACNLGAWSHRVERTQP